MYDEFGGAPAGGYTNFTSLPPEEERQFVVFEQRTREAAAKATLVGWGIAGALVVVALAVILGFWAPLKPYGQVPEEPVKAGAPGPSLAPSLAPTPAPAPTDPAAPGAVPAVAPGTDPAGAAPGAPAAPGVAPTGAAPTGAAPAPTDPAAAPAPAPASGATKASPAQLTTPH